MTEVSEASNTEPCSDSSAYLTARHAAWASKVSYIILKSHHLPAPEAQDTQRSRSAHNFGSTLAVR
jgi:hypothetical protein